MEAAIDFLQKRIYRGAAHVGSHRIGLRESPFVSLPQPARQRRLGVLRSRMPGPVCKRRLRRPDLSVTAALSALAVPDLG